nr:hypothetical protein [Acetivibrio ethanolgignens]
MMAPCRRDCSAGCSDRHYTGESWHPYFDRVRLLPGGSTEGATLCAGLRDGSPHRVKGETPWQVKGAAFAQEK